MLTPLPLASPAALITQRLVAELDVLLGGVGIGEGAGLGGGDRLLPHQLLGEPFIRLDACGFLVGTEDFQLGVLKAIGKARRQGDLQGRSRPDRSCSLWRIARPGGSSSGSSGTLSATWAVPGLPGRANSSVTRERGRELPRQRVLRATISNDQYFHDVCLAFRACRTPATQTLAVP